MHTNRSQSTCTNHTIHSSHTVHVIPRSRRGHSKHDKHNTCHDEHDDHYDDCDGNVGCDGAAVAMKTTMIRMLTATVLMVMTKLGMEVEKEQQTMEHNKNTPAYL